MHFLPPYSPNLNSIERSMEMDEAKSHLQYLLRKF